MKISGALRSFILAKKADGRAERTIEDYYRCLDPFVQWCESQGLDTNNLDRHDFRRYVAEELRSNGWAESTVAIHIRNLRCFLRWIYTEGYTKNNLALAVENPGQSIRWDKIPSMEEIQALVDACTGEWADRDKAVIFTFLDTGLRLGGMVKLKRQDVRIYPNKTEIAVYDSKTDKHRLVFLREEGTKALRHYLAKRDDDYEALWIGRQGPLTKSGLRKIIYRRGDQAGLERSFYPHLFRKFFATWWMRNGGDRMRLQWIAGWESAEMIKVYVKRAKRQDLEEAHRRLSPVDAIFKD